MAADARPAGQPITRVGQYRVISRKEARGNIGHGLIVTAIDGDTITVAHTYVTDLGNRCKFSPIAGTERQYDRADLYATRR